MKFIPIYRLFINVSCCAGRILRIYGKWRGKETSPSEVKRIGHSEPLEKMRSAPYSKVAYGKRRAKNGWVEKSML